MTFPRSEWLYRVVFLVVESDRATADQLFADMQGATIEEVGSSFVETIPPGTYDENFNLIPPENPEWRYVLSAITEPMRLAWLSAVDAANLTVKMYRFINPYLAVEQKAEVAFTLLGLTQQAATTLADTGTDLILLDTNVVGTGLTPGDRLPTEQDVVANFVGTL